MRCLFKLTFVQLREGAGGENNVCALAAVADTPPLNWASLGEQKAGYEARVCLIY